MSNRKTRERQLAKLAARRAAERRKKRRQRILTITGITVAVLAIGIVAVVALTGGTPKKDHAAKSPTPSASPTASPSPAASPGTRIGSVTPNPAPATVACGAKAPPGAGKPKPQFAGPPPMTIDPAKSYVAVMQTSCGTIKIQLDSGTAPQTVNSFVFLADHHYFDGQYFHRLDTSIDVVQGGDPVGDGSHGPGYQIPDELTGNETYPPGTLAMANAGANTGGSQFFLITGPKGHLLDDNNTYTVFGHVVDGLDVAQKIQAMPIQDPSAGLTGQQPKQAIYMDKVTIDVSPSGSGASPTDGSVIPTTNGSGTGPGD